MSAQGTNEGRDGMRDMKARPRTNSDSQRHYVAKDNRDGRGTGNGRPGTDRRNAERNGERNFSDRGRGPRGERGESSGYNRGERQDRFNRDGQKKDFDGSKPRYDRPKFDKKGPAQGGPRRDNSFNAFMKDKDDDEKDNGRRSKPMHPKETKKETVAQPDKAKTQARLEKEKKTVNKKQKSDNAKKKETSRPQPKQKRSNNINYTREYMNGAYDDYEDYYDL